MDLNGKSVVVTGAGRGLGLAYAEALAVAGAGVVVNDIDRSAAEAAVDAIRGSGGTAVAHAGPVGTGQMADALVARAVDEFGRLDAMVTNAGILRDRVLWNMSDEDFDHVVNVHLRGTFTCSRSAARHFREADHGGRLVLVGSPAGQHGNFGQGNYAACKAGITAFARTWAMELAKARVTVNCVVPTAATEMTKTIPAFSTYIEAWESAGTPLPGWLRRDQAIGSPGEVAPLVVYLVSDESASITGQTIGLGGDRLAVWSYPAEAGTAFQEGGWDAEAIASAFSSTFADQRQNYGIAPPLDPGTVA